MIGYLLKMLWQLKDLAKYQKLVQILISEDNYQLTFSA